MGRRIFIGDVHGHYDSLMHLIEAVSLEADDRLFFVGDLIDRGPQSYQVVEFIRSHQYPCVLGNHEQLLVEAFPKGEAHMPSFQGWLYSGGQATLASYRNIDVLFEHIHWIKTLPFYLDLGDIWLVHAGVHPRRSLQQQTAHEFCWIRDLFHSHDRPYFADKMIVTGHTITFTLPGIQPGQLAQGPGWLDIDTGAYHPKSGWLSAVDLDSNVVYQANTFQNLLRVQALQDATSIVEQRSLRQKFSYAMRS
ncbi:MAG: serine/threonine protein phosphatase [Leptolyngbya sp. SIO4C1]|nr:serine/threonine protein phosphatase [Leptolyngbya sp. SIO4C1]